MYDSGARAVARRAQARGCVARERSAGYDGGRDDDAAGSAADRSAGGGAGAGGPAHAGSLAEALAGVEAAIDRVAAVDLDAESAREVLDAAVGLAHLEARLVASQLAVLDAAGRRMRAGWTGR